MLITATSDITLDSLVELMIKTTETLVFLYMKNIGTCKIKKKKKPNLNKKALVSYKIIISYLKYLLLASWLTIWKVSLNIHKHKLYFFAAQPADPRSASRCQKTPARGGWICGQFWPQRPLNVAPQRKTLPYTQLRSTQFSGIYMPFIVVVDSNQSQGYFVT